MLQRLAMSGDPALAETAGRTLRLTQSLVAFRAQLSMGAPSPRRLSVKACAARSSIARAPATCRAVLSLGSRYHAQSG